jgi:hypothetical protein
VTFRRRLQIAFLLVVLAPIVALALGVRGMMRDRLTSDYRTRVAAHARGIEQDLHAQSEVTASRLRALAAVIAEDNSPWGARPCWSRPAPPKSPFSPSRGRTPCGSAGGASRWLAGLVSMPRFSTA